jgi:hypothetical protein
MAGLYARKKQLRLNSAAIKIEGRSIDSLNIANLRRRINRSLVPSAPAKIDPPLLSKNDPGIMLGRHDFPAPLFL